MENENEAVQIERISNLLLDKKKENLKYNKQEIPEILKYNSDDEESLNSKENIEKNDLIENNNTPKINDDKLKEENNKDEKLKKEEKNSYEKLILKKMDIYSDEDNNNQNNQNQEKEINKEVLEKEKEEEKKELNEEKEIMNDENKNNEIEKYKYSSKTFSMNIEINNETEKKNVLKLLSLIKNKMNEKEKLDKEKESIKEEMFKRAKSQEGDKIKNSDDEKNQSPKVFNQIKQIIYNKKRKTLNNNKSMNTKNYKDFSSIEKDDVSEKNIRNINIYRHHISNKSMDINLEKNIANKNKKINLQKKLYYNGSINNIYNNLKKTSIKSGKSLGKINENKKIINNYYFSNGNYNFNNFFHNNLSPKNTNKIYRKKNLTLKDNNIELSNDYINSYTKYNNIINENSSEKNYKTNIENYDSSPNYSSMNSNRAKNKINLKVNKKSFYVNTDNFDLENISFKNNQNNSNYKINTNSPIINSKKYLIGNKQQLNYSKKSNYVIKEIKEIYTNKKKIRNKIWNYFKIEDLLIIEEKMKSLIEYIKFNKEIHKQCFDIFNFFFNCSLYKKLENIFPDEKYTNIIKSCIKFALISLTIIYEYSFHKNIFNQTKNALFEIAQMNYNNLTLMKYQIMNNIIRNNFDKNGNVWIQYILKEINNINLNLKEDNTLLIISYINNNNENINLKLSYLLNNFSLTENNQILLDLLAQIKTKSYNDINSFMTTNIIKIENIEGSLIASVFLRNNSIFSPVNPPYLISPPIAKPYTLVLDLDETLVNFKIKSGREGYVRLRPFLFGFLEEVSQYYELIIFTSATEAYANSVIEAIEQEKKYFDFIFYRQHTIIIGNEFVKDLTRIGRPLNSTIIVDNMPQNFRFQKENGICIKPFWGQDSNDKTLYNLIPILIDIAKIGGDVRLSLNKYKDEIISKITSNIN